MKKYLFSKKLIWFFLILSVTVFAGSRDHDGGFFLRLSAGSGFAKTEVRGELGDTASLKCFGFSGDGNIAVGAMILPNLAVHGTLFGWSVLEPSAELWGSSENLTEPIELSGLGVGLTYYIMPANIYISSSVGIADLMLDLSRWWYTGDTDMGIIFDVTLGKEWWVGGSWGLGAAAGFGYHSVGESGYNDNWSGYSLCVRFSATLN